MSSAGSLLALLAYPVWIEPAWSVGATAEIWTVGSVACGVLILGVGRMAERPGASSVGAVEASPVAGDDAGLDPHVDASRIALWIALPATAVLMLMGVTNALCLDVANVPFLWIAPLALYLGTLIASFGGVGVARTGWAMGTMLVATAGVLVGADAAQGGALGFARTLPVQIGVHSLLLVGGCMALHGELYRMRPPAASLTLFYLCVSGGGALGGLFAGAVAPLVFPGYWDLPLAIALAWGLWLTARARAEGSLVRTHRLARVAAGVGTLGLIGAAVLGAQSSWRASGRSSACCA